MEQKYVDNLRLALDQNQPLGNERFYGRIERMERVRREARPRGRPRREGGSESAKPPGQGELGL